MRIAIGLLLAIGCTCLWTSTGRAQSQPDVLTLAQGADVLADLLTCTVDRTDARVDAMQHFLHEIGKEEAFAEAPRLSRPSTPVYYNQVAQAAVAFVKQGGAKYADPA